MASKQPRVKGMLNNKVGLMWPQSPRGIASLMDLQSEPDLTISDDHIVIGWETDPEVIREYVPEPLEVDGSGRMYLSALSRWGYSSRNYKEFISAERQNHNEAIILIPCSYKGQKFTFEGIFSWGTRDWLAQTGRPVGVNHKWAKVQMTQFHPFHPTWNGPHEGARICVTVENVGLVLRGYVELKRPAPPGEVVPGNAENKQTKEQLSKGGYGGHVCHRYIWDVTKGKPLVNDLVVHVGDNFVQGPIWTGDSWIKFYEAENEEVLQFQPKRMIGGWWRQLHFDHQGTAPYVLHDFGDVSPYASRPRIRELLEGG
jgi:acetoacetate decarboxylase